jgi:DNA-binding NtrC family response regulator
MSDVPILKAADFAGVVRVVAPAPASASIQSPSSSGAALALADWKPLPQAVAELETRTIRAALQACRGNKLAAAKMLGIARATLYEKLAVMPPLVQG